MRKIFIDPFFHIFISELSTCYDTVENGTFSRKGQAPVTLAEVGEVRAKSRRTCPYCTISICSSKGVTCDRLDEYLSPSKSIVT
jgi:hypothetical protein